MKERLQRRQVKTLNIALLLSNFTLEFFINKTCVRDVYSESPLNTDNSALLRAPLASLLTGLHCKNTFASIDA